MTGNGKKNDFLMAEVGLAAYRQDIDCLAMGTVAYLEGLLEYGPIYLTEEEFALGPDVTGARP